MSHNNIGRRDFTKLSAQLVAALTVSGFVNAGSSREGLVLSISPETANSIANLAGIIYEKLGTVATEILRHSRIGNWQNKPVDLANIRAEISELIAGDYDNNRVLTVGGIVMANTEIAVVLELNRMI